MTDRFEKLTTGVSRIYKKIQKIKKHEIHDGSDIDKRRNMLHASFYAGCAFTKSYVGYVHAIAHSLGGGYNIPHGLANAMILMQMPHICLSKKIKQMNWKHSILR